MTSKTFRTYGKRSTRTVLTPLFDAPEPSPSRDSNSLRSYSPTSTGGSKAQPVADVAVSIDNPPKAKRAPRQPGLNRRQPYAHLVTPGRRGVSILPNASASRSVAGHKRLRAVPSPTKGRRRFQAPENPAKEKPISAPPSPLRETDVNRIHLGQLNNGNAAYFPDLNRAAAADHTLFPCKLVVNAGTKNDPIDLSENDGNDGELVSRLPPKRKRTGRQRRTTKSKAVDSKASSAIGAPPQEKDPGGHDLPPGVIGASKHGRLGTRKTGLPLDHNTIETLSAPDTFSPSPTGPVRKFQHVVQAPQDPAGSFSPPASRTAVNNSIIPAYRRYGLPQIPPSPTASGASTASQVSTPRHTRYIPSISHARPVTFRRPFGLGSSPFPGKRLDSPFLRRGIGPVALTFDDLLTSFSDLSFSISVIVTPASERTPARPTPLSQLLRACQQDDVDDFSDFVRDFPQKYYADTLPYRKVGEASYSEVFGVGDIVLKIVPLLSDHKNGHAADEQPAETPIEDALREILFISRMGSLQGGSGFSALLGAHVVEGVYPSSLLSEWDRWDLCNKSESIRPGCFPESQLYAVIEMSYSGEDLEKYKFPKRTAWQQAASVFWQAARSIERAEHHLRFEHRDLHWGQVLILPVTHVVAEPTAYLDDPGHGVAVTVIDFGYSRMDAPNPEDPPLYTPFEPEVFEGQGDYQYDIYRMMRNHNGDKWDDYRPVTNLMWLHYLTVKLLKHKGLRKPLRAKGQAAAAFDREMRCYNALCETEELLRAVVQSYSRPQAAGKRRAIRGPQWQCGGDLCAWGREQQWIK